MNETTPICGACCERLCEHGLLCAIIMDEVCRASLQEDYPFVHETESDSYVIKATAFLESKGYIVSTDAAASRIYLKPKGAFNENKGCFCWCNSL